jgi:hypothetical protein
VAVASALLVGTLLPGRGFLARPALAAGRAYAGHWHAWPAFKDAARYGAVAPADAAAADYDGDGRDDLAVRTATGAWVVDLAADGLHGPDQVLANGYPTAGSPAPADYDGDGQADPAVLDDGGVLRVDRSGDGLHGVDASYSEAAGGQPVPADFDGDGRDDFAALGRDGTLRVDLAANGWGAPDWTRAYGVTGAAAAGDVDGDGKADVAVLDSAGGLRVAWGSAGLAALGPATPGYPADSQLALADADGDGQADAHILDPANGVWLVDDGADGLDDPSGGSTARLDGFSFPGGRMAAPDVDGDGKADLTVLTAAKRWLAELSTDPAAPLPTFTDKATMLDSAGGAVTPGDAAAGDYDGDGKADLAARSASGAWVVDLAATGFGPPDQVLANSYPTTGSPAPADYDGDGKADPAVLDDAGVLGVDRSGDGLNGVDATFNEGPGGAVPMPADFDGDGRDDFAALGSDGTLRVDLAANGFAAPDWTRALGVTGGSAASGDVDGDGKADVAVLDAAGSLRVALGSAGLSALGAPVSGYAADAQLAVADATGDGKADVHVLDPAAGTWLVDDAADGFNPSAPSTTRVEGFSLPDVRMAAADVDGDGTADLTALTRFAFGASFEGDPAGSPQARWMVRAGGGERHSLTGYWQGEGALGQILDDKPANPSIGDFNLVHMAWGATSYGSAADSYSGAFLRNRIDKAMAGGSQVILDLTYLFLNHPDQLPALRADLCPTADACRFVWLEVMDEPYGHGETPAVFEAQVDQLRAAFPEPQFKIVQVEGTGDAASPGRPCPDAAPNPVYFWCWYQLDPQHVIPAGVDIVALDVFRYGELVKSYNALRSITAKPVITWAPSWWFCSPICPSFPVSKAEQKQGGESGPPEDTLPFADYGLDDPQVLGTAIFLYGRTPDRSLPATDPYGPMGLPANQRQTYLRVQRSMMWVRNVAPVPAAPPPAGDYPGTYHGTVLAPNPAGSVVLNRFVSQGCRPDPAVQGTDGYVVDVGRASTVDVTSTGVGATGYDVLLYDELCHQAGYAVADPTGAVHLAAPHPVHWAVVHLGLGAQLQFTLTAS